MVDLNLEQNEHIICRTKEAWIFDGNEERELEMLILTNNHLISVYKKSVALFFDGKTVVDKKPLALISIRDNLPQVKNIMDDNFGEALQVLFDNGMEELYFLGDAHKSEYQQWENDIKKVIIENSKATMKNDKMSEDSLVVEKSKPVVATIENSNMFVFCTNCGEKNNIGAKFCQNCGTLLVNVNKSKQNEALHKEEQQQSAYSERKQEYAGKIIKCPNCGEVLKSFVVLCPSCGYELRSVEANSSLKELSVKLEAIDLQPDILPKETFLKNFSRKLTEKEKQKITLIRNFPIPNTKEDLYEFLIMAASNIDTEHIEGWNSSGQSEGEKALSDAWKAKYEQAYHKANISFGSSKEFQELNKSYLSKIQKHERKKSMFNKGIIIFIAIYIIACIIGVCFMYKDNSTKQKAVDEENERLEFILDDIQQYIEEGEYAKARSLNATLVFNTSMNLQSAIDSKEHWDDVRKELYDVIKNAENQDSEAAQEE